MFTWFFDWLDNKQMFGAMSDVYVENPEYDLEHSERERTLEFLRSHKIGVEKECL